MKRKTATKRRTKVLTKRELNYFRKLLLEKKMHLIDELKHSREEVLRKSPRDAAGDISGYSIHMADVATDNYDRQFSLDIATSEREILCEIGEAIQRIENRTFGICQACKLPISKTRLKAVPHTYFCLKCQREKEKH
ncbi:MAG: TraR/DksA C4-type zinc finger protein [Candidatus Omnitrophica bacterium]|nr:TraR/DksA C4-type zinc finger protein [Candidatus Omnitrophota bacterium]